MELDHMQQESKKSFISFLKEKLKKKEIEEIEISEQDEENFNYFKKKGGYQEFPNYVYSDNKFYTTIRIHTYNEELEELWLTAFAGEDNLAIELDIDTEDTALIKKSINRGIEIEQMKQRRARSYSDAQDAYDNAQENRNLYNEIKGGKGLNKISLNFIIWEDTKEKLSQKIKSVKEKMIQYDIEGSIFTNSIAEDLKITKYKNATATISPTAGVRTFFPFNFQEIIDVSGTFLGYSKNGGQIVIDHALKTTDGNRLSNDILVTGKTRNGKSSLVKNILKKELLQGHMSIILDPENEYAPFVKYLGGEVIDINTNSIINPLEYRTELNDEGKVIGFSEHLNNLRTFFSIIEPEFNSLDKGRMNALLKEFYTAYFKTVNGIDEDEYFDVMAYDTSKLSVNIFPTFEFLKKVLDKEIENKKIQGLRDEEYTSYTLIEQTLDKIVYDYGQYFVGKTTISTNDMNMICFNLKPIETLEESVKNAVIYNILNVYCNERIIKNKEYNITNKDILEYPRILRITLDEAHAYLNTSNPQFVEWFKNAIKRFGKYSACSLISSQSTLDFKPLNVNNDVSENLLKIFNEILYKYFFFQELPTEGAEYVNISGLLKKEDIDIITKQQRGDFLLKLPQRKIVGHHFIDKFEAEVLYNTEVKNVS